MQTSPNPSILIQEACIIYWSIIALFILCNYFENICNQFDEFDFYEQCDWYTFPAKIKRFLPLIICNTIQCLFRFEGYGDISCSRETCKRVISFHFRLKK